MARRLIAILGIALAVASGVPLVLAHQVEDPPPSITDPPKGQEASPPPTGDEPETPAPPLPLGPTEGTPLPGDPAANPGEGDRPEPAAIEEAPAGGPIAPSPAVERPASRGDAMDRRSSAGGIEDHAEPAPPPARTPRLRIPDDGPIGDRDVMPAQAPAPAAPAPAADRFPLGMHSVGLTVEMVAPTSANLNKPIKYKIVVKNTGTSDALGVVVGDSLPAGLQFQASKPEPSSPAPGLTWRKDVLSAGSEWIIEVTALPTEKGPIEHAAVVTLTGGSRSRTQVRKPELKVEQQASVSRELKGRSVEFKIGVTNVGDGSARDVVLQATLSDGLKHAQGKVLELPLKEAFGKAALGPGESHEVSLVVDTVAGGEQTCTVVATSPDAESSPQSTGVQKVAVVEPQLNLTLVGNKRGYPDGVARYTLKVENTGTAPAKKVKVVAYPGMGGRVYKEGGGKYLPEHRALLWSLPQLAEGDSKEFTFQILLGGPGVFRIGAVAVAEGVSRKDVDIKTDVVGTADVDFTVTEAQRGGLSIGDEVDYVVKITNRGTETARDLQVHANLSPHLECVEIGEPSGKKGGWDKANRTVLFPQIPELPAEESLELSIRVKAVEGGLGSCEVVLTHQGLKEGEKIRHAQYTRVINADDPRE